MQIVFQLIITFLVSLNLRTASSFHFCPPTIKFKSGLQRSKLHSLEKQRRLWAATDSSSGQDDEARVKVPLGVQKMNAMTVGIMKTVLKAIYSDREYSRFAALETIARVPYYSYTSVLHLYETLGWSRRKELLLTHFGQSWNELHHLLIMESLIEENKEHTEVTDKIVAAHLSFFYYWIVVALYIMFPATAYDLNKHVELHAYSTYDEFLKKNEESLKKQSPPNVALNYYNGIKDAEKGLNGEKSRGEPVSTLYDVFVRIRNDEGDHASTMLQLSCLENIHGGVGGGGKGEGGTGTGK